LNVTSGGEQMTPLTTRRRRNKHHAVDGRSSGSGSGSGGPPTARTHLHTVVRHCSRSARRHGSRHRRRRHRNASSNVITRFALTHVCRSVDRCHGRIIFLCCRRRCRGVACIGGDG
jgi:hypothetical protein